MITTHPPRGGHVLELGCGVGNGVAQLARSLGPMLRVITCLDFSPRAIELLEVRFCRRPGDAADESGDASSSETVVQHHKKNGRRRRPVSEEVVIEARVADVVRDAFFPPATTTTPQKVDGVTCFFVLSALEPSSMPRVVAKIADALRPGSGRVVVRDYGRYDQAQLRFGKGRKLDDNFYVKQDGTRCYYFDTTDLDALFSRDRGFDGHADFVCQVQANRATGLQRRRVFVQAVYRRLLAEDDEPR
mmetsp:Transcript_12048/g.48488  ORF Transcript_12048/g.48488 Transcript_12048/m.48488 type:complete len:246 (+) Transcript_12048:335-1072(+)